jgi:hypothetical protein
MSLFVPSCHQGLLGVQQVIPLGFDTAPLRSIYGHENIRVVDCDLAGAWVLE